MLKTALSRLAEPKHLRLSHSWPHAGQAENAKKETSEHVMNRVQKCHGNLHWLVPNPGFPKCFYFSANLRSKESFFDARSPKVYKSLNHGKKAR